MKRAATLVAGLLLVTGTVFGASEFKMTGATVEGTVHVINSQYGALGSEDGDLNMIFKGEKSGTYGTLGLELNVNKNGDQGLFLNYTKTDGDFTIGTKAKLINDTGVILNGASRAMNTNGDTYIKWNVMGSKTTNLTFYPYGVDGMNWDKDTFNSFNSTNTNGGFKLATKVGATDVSVRFATGNGTNATANIYAVKGEVTTKVATATITAAAGLTAGNTNDVTFAAAKVEMPVASLSLLAEANMEKTGDADAKTGVFVKGSYKMPVMNGYTPTAYASAKLKNEGAAGTSTINGVANVVTGATTEIEAGLGLNKGSFTITPKVVLNTTEKEVLVKEDKNDKSKSAFAAKVTVKYGF